MTKKKVTAPLTYDPGKGRPKEYLAYLNYQEMQALKRLNGNNMERGPRGLPSFPPADARGSSSKASSTTRTSGPSSSLNAPARTAPSSASRPSSTTGSRGPSSSLNAPARTAPSSASRPSGSGFAGIGGGGARDSGQAAARQTAARQAPAPSSRFPSSGGGGRDSGQVAARADSSFKQAAERQNTTAANKTPALKQDRQRTINVGPMGTPVKVGAPSGQERRIAPRATVTTPMATQGPSFRSPLDARISNRFAINDAKLRSGALGIEGVPSVSQIAAENARRLNTIKMAQQYAQYRSPPGSYPAAPQGVFGPRAGFDAGYLRTATMPGMFTEGQTYGPSTRQVPGPAGFYAEVPKATSLDSGVVPPMRMRPGFTPDRPMPISGEGFFAPSEESPPRSSAEATLRAYEESKRVSPKIQDRVPASGRLTVGRSAVVPTAPPRPPTYGRSAVPPTYQALASEGGLYKAPVRDPAVERALAEAGFDPTGRRLEAMIDPSIPGRNVEALKNYAPAVGPGGVVGGMVYTRPDLKRSPISPSDSASYFGDIKQPFLSGWNSVFQREWVDPAKRALSATGEGISALGGAIADAVGSGINALADINLRPGSVVSTDEGLKIVNPDKTLSPYSAERERIIKMMSPDYQYQVPADPALSGFPKNPPLPSMPAPDDVETILEIEEYPEVKPPKPRLRPTAPSITPPRPRLRPAELMDSYIDFENTSEGVTSPETPDVDYTDQGSADDGVSSPGPLTEEQREEAQKIIRRGNRVAGQFIGGVTGPLGGLAARGGLKLYEKAKLEQLERYAAMPPAEKLAAEKRNPELIGWANRLGIDHQSDYGDYLSWADRSGLRAPPTREGGGRESSGIADLVSDATGGEEPSAPEAPSTPSGRRPDIYYMWDLGVNIPSPGDPNYTQYQAYLAERLAAQRAMGYV